MTTTVILFIPILFTLFAAFVRQPSFMQRGKGIAAPEGAIGVLEIFAIVVAAFGLFSVFYYWQLLKSHVDDLMFGIWLLLTMIFGMFVQVLAENRRAGKALGDVKGEQMLYPLLFSIVVFYPIWMLAAAAPRNLFVFHAAFLNGYFWESVVSEARRPPKP